MSYTEPRTWVTGEIVTSALMNTHVRDMFNMQTTDSVQEFAFNLNAAWNINPPDGAKGYLRSATDPFLPGIALVYDELKGRWVGPPFVVFSDDDGKTAVFNNQTTRNIGHLPWKSMRDADLTYEVRLIGQGMATGQGAGSQTVNVFATVGESGSGFTNSTYIFSFDGSNDSWEARDSGWVILPIASLPVVDVLQLSYSLTANNTGQTTYGLYTLWARAVSV